MSEEHGPLMINCKASDLKQVWAALDAAMRPTIQFELADDECEMLRKVIAEMQEKISEARRTFKAMPGIFG